MLCLMYLMTGSICAWWWEKYVCSCSCSVIWGKRKHQSIVSMCLLSRFLSSLERLICLILLKWNIWEYVANIRTVPSLFRILMTGNMERWCMPPLSFPFITNLWLKKKTKWERDRSLQRKSPCVSSHHSTVRSEDEVENDWWAVRCPVSYGEGKGEWEERECKANFQPTSQLPSAWIVTDTDRRYPMYVGCVKASTHFLFPSRNIRHTQASYVF